MGLFKKIRRITHPGTRLFDKRGNNDGYIDIGKRDAQNADLASAMEDYGKIETNVRDTYTNAAKKAGTYADTAEFKSGLGSEVQAGVRGARVNAAQRINAMRRAMGNNEEFKPEGVDQTQGNNTADKLMASPEKEEASATGPDADAPEAPAGANATTSLQSSAQKRLAALRAVQG